MATAVVELPADEPAGSKAVAEIAAIPRRIARVRALVLPRMAEPRAARRFVAERPQRTARENIAVTARNILRPIAVWD